MVGGADNADQRHDEEDHPPGRQRNHRAAEQRRQDRRNAEHQHDQRHQPRRVRARMQVAHDRARDGHAGAGADALDEAGDDQPFDRGRQTASDRADRVKRHAEIERRPPAMAVGDRPVNDLAARDREEERDEAALRGSGRGPEIGGNRGQCRQVHVDRERADRGQQAQHDRVAREASSHVSRTFGRSAGRREPRPIPWNNNAPHCASQHRLSLSPIPADRLWPDIPCPLKDDPAGRSIVSRPPRFRADRSCRGRYPPG